MESALDKLETIAAKLANDRRIADAKAVTDCLTGAAVFKVRDDGAVDIIPLSEFYLTPPEQPTPFQSAHRPIV